MKKVVTIGGGTGSYTVLSGLKNIKGLSLTALVSMADDGGSTGILRDELGVLPPGDIRQCLVALSEHTNLVRKLMNYRFSNGKLEGHSFGNLFLAALEKVSGSFIKGAEVASEILKVRGSVIPITNNKAELAVKLPSGKVVYGESKINRTNLRGIDIKNFFYKDNVNLNKKAEAAIKNADYIIIGPGNFYCSVVPNLIVRGFKEALLKSKARVILPINLTNKKNHTEGWGVKSYVNAIEMLIGKPVDKILVNNKSPSRKQVEYYKRYYNLKKNSDLLVVNDLDDNRIIRDNLLSTKIVPTLKDRDIRGFIRHDSAKIAECIVEII